MNLIKESEASFRAYFRLLEKPLPLVVLISAYDHYANQAAKLDVLDYLLKPASVARLTETLSLARDRFKFKGAEALRCQWPDSIA